MSTSEIVTSVIALSAVLSPILTAIINNHHQLKLKEIEVNEQRRNEVFSDFISSASSAIISGLRSDKYLESIVKVHLYAPKDVWDMIKEMDGFIEINSLNNARYFLIKISKKLNAYTSLKPKV